MSQACNIQWNNAKPVQVNQRALVDKVLARYSAEFTIFRELFQNSDDAQADKAEIRFETRDFVPGDPDRRGIWKQVYDSSKNDLPDLRTTLVHKWTFKNNGMIFRDQDWNRLEQIAEGNPDANTIGAFGVGFYTVFSVTDMPVIKSGDKCMQFRWDEQGNQLVTLHGSIDRDPWTTFELSLRKEDPIPRLFDLIGFLATSIAFMTYLNDIKVFLDDTCLAKVSKAPGNSRPLSMREGLKNSSPQGIMNVTQIMSTDVDIIVEVMHLVYSAAMSDKHAEPAQATKEMDPMAFITTNVTLVTFSADVDVRLDEKMFTELHRSLKKHPPTELKYELTYTSKEEYQSSKIDGKPYPNIRNISRGLRGDIDGMGTARIFIGHATAQTTGFGGHVSGRFIPTVERESIDLVNQHIAVWNKELLHIGGYLARSAYEEEMSNIKNVWDQSPNPGNPLLHDRALHALQFFTFHVSTPSPEVSILIEDAFFSCSTTHPLAIMSNNGVRHACDVRLPNTTFSAFLTQLPVVPQKAFTTANRMFKSLETRGLVKTIAPEDVLAELRARPFTEGEMAACLRWWLSAPKRDPVLLHVAVLKIEMPIGIAEKTRPLSAIKKFINYNTIGDFLPMDSPLPDDVLPLGISKQLSALTSLPSFPWTEYSVADWLRYLTGPIVCGSDIEHNINLSSSWAERVLIMLAEVWPTLSRSDMDTEIIALLHDQTCIPTSLGQRTPGQSYFASVNLFDDLPLVTLPSQAVIDGQIKDVLRTLGVREHVSLEILLNKIKSCDLTAVKLAKYLVLVQSLLTDLELERLRGADAFMRESRLSDASPRHRHRIGDLYKPSDVFRKLGLAIIDWGNEHEWSATPNEAELMCQLGLREYPPLDILVNLCASADEEVRSTALKYLLDNISTHYHAYDSVNFADISYVPALKGGNPCISKPTEVFASPKWASMGFMVLRQSVSYDVTKLKIEEDPPTAMLVSWLQRHHPKSVGQAREWFDHIASRQSEFSEYELEKLSQIEMVPAKPTEYQRRDGNGSNLFWYRPNQCYLSRNITGLHSKIFVFVDFGDRANRLLQACKMEQEPSAVDVVELLLANPQVFLKHASNYDNYLTELRAIAIAANRGAMQDHMEKMSKEPVLVAQRRKPINTTNELPASTAGWMSDDQDLEYVLLKADEIVIIDDTNTYNLFGDSLSTAPEDNLLENFYASLGTPRLSSLVEETCMASKEIKDCSNAKEIRSIVLHRLPLFVHGRKHSWTFDLPRWLGDENGLVVKTYKTMEVTKTLRCRPPLSRLQNTSAVARRDNDGSIELVLARTKHSPTDMYDVAATLLGVLLKSPKVHDILLFTTILTTDETTLERRGYNVKRILKPHETDGQKADGLAAMKPESTIAKRTWYSVPFYSFKQKFRPSQYSNHQGRSKVKLRQSVTPWDNYSPIVNSAIKACAPEHGRHIRHVTEIQVAEKCYEHGYCGISGHVSDLDLVEVGQFKVFVSRDVHETRADVQTKLNALTLFHTVINALAGVYNIPTTSLHIYYDLGGTMIAFNRKKCIFLNLRYFEKLHASDVQNGEYSKAYISWYFTLAHEIAHNEIHAHDSAHEWLFSAICQDHLVALGELLSSFGAESPRASTSHVD